MKNSFNILIVEDELMIAEMTKEMLLGLKYSVIGIAKNNDEAQMFLSKSNDIDLVILDINLNDRKSGIDIGEKINEKYKIPFVYLTSYSDPSTIKKAAKTTPEAYILKPFTKSDLYTTIEIIKARKNQNSSSIIVKDGDMTVKIDSSDINYIKSDNNYIEISTEEKKYVVRNSIDNFLDELSNSNFIRVHGSYAVNIMKIDAVNGQYILIGNIKCPLSRMYKNEVFNKFSD